ncbi:MAG TPA: ANTAR domain-containing protein [Jatrophihabitans sp.]|nr:ANTAR domain-containing protein [Jatrophihabitans sp.]
MLNVVGIIVGMPDPSQAPLSTAELIKRILQLEEQGQHDQARISELEEQAASDRIDVTALRAQGDIDQHLIAELEAQAIIDRSQIENLALALNNARRIGAALGIIMYSYKVTEDQAFTTLRIASQHTHRKLRDIAEDVLLTGTMPDSN